MLEFCAEPYSLRAAAYLLSPIVPPTNFQLNTLESHPSIRRASNPFRMIFLQKKVGGGWAAHFPCQTNISQSQGSDLNVAPQPLSAAVVAIRMIVILRESPRTEERKRALGAPGLFAEDHSDAP